MADVAVLAETPVSAGSVPWFELPGWRERFGVVAGITGRGDPGAAFDLGLASDAPARAVLDRWRLLQATFPAAGLVVARQVHGATVLWHEPRGGWTIFEGADGHAVAAPGLLLAVSVADCIPIYLVDPVKRAVALLHSGWRGTAAGILRAGVELLRTRAGSRPADLVGHAGVGICGACYEVGGDVATACGRPPESAEPVRLDLRAVIAGQARDLGISRMTVSPHCSSHHRDRFMSHRASGGGDGRMVALLGLLPTAG